MTDIRCGICDGDPDRRRSIDKMLAANKSAASIERDLKALGVIVKAETVGRHRRTCLGGATKPPEIVQLAAKASATDSAADFAALVKAEAVRKLNAGELKVTTTDGLSAQALLDKREERAKDRDLLTNLGRLLLGVGLAPPMTVIDVNNHDDEAEIPLLTG